MKTIDAEIISCKYEDEYNKEIVKIKIDGSKDLFTMSSRCVDIRYITEVLERGYRKTVNVIDPNNCLTGKAIDGTVQYKVRVGKPTKNGKVLLQAYLALKGTFSYEFMKMLKQYDFTTTFYKTVVINKWLGEGELCDWGDILEYLKTETTLKVEYLNDSGYNEFVELNEKMHNFEQLKPKLFNVPADLRMINTIVNFK